MRTTAYIVAELINDPAFYKGPSRLVLPGEDAFLWEPTASTATWFFMKEQAARIARSIDRALVADGDCDEEDVKAEPTQVWAVADWLKFLKGENPPDRKEIAAIELRIKTGKVPHIAADRVALHRK